MWMSSILSLAPLIQFMDSATNDPASLKCRSVCHLEGASFALAEVVVALPTTVGIILAGYFSSGHHTAHPIAVLAPS